MMSTLPRLFAYLMLDYAFGLRRARARHPDKEPSASDVEGYARIVRARRRARDAIRTPAPMEVGQVIALANEFVGFHHLRCPAVNHDNRQCERRAGHEGNHYEPGCNFGWHTP